MVSDRFRAAAFAQQTDEVAVVLVTINHAALETPIRFCTNPGFRVSEEPPVYATDSRADRFYFIQAKVELPDEQDGAPAAKLTIANIDRDTIALIRSVVSPAPTMTLEVVLASTPDTVERSFEDFIVVDATPTAQTVEFTLTLDTQGVEPIPAMNFDPGTFPGLFNKL